MVDKVINRVGQNHIHIRCTFGREITVYTVIHGVHVRCIYTVLANSRYTNQVQKTTRSTYRSYGHFLLYGAQLALHGRLDVVYEVVDDLCF